MSRTSLFSLGALTAAALLAPALAAGEGTTVRLWSGKAPGEQAAIEPEKADRSAANPAEIQRVSNVTDPTLAVFPAPAEKRTGAALIIAPGGAYQFLSWAHEGEEIARWFNGQGVTAFVLKYRVPTRSFDPGNKLALMDAERSVSLVRSRAKEWGVDPAKIGFLGFSAGGHLGVNLENNWKQRAYEAADAADQTSCRPDFVALIYPGGMMDKNDPTKLAPGMAPAADTPPTFIAVAGDDKGCAEPSARYWLALRAAGVQSELHAYASGGHGFGMRSRAGTAATWPERCAEWMRTIAVLPKAEAK
ncbi:MAG: esterase/lipase [Armatimonadetes bacterium]|jgi:acetyl esterase/lipase|nr:esterase/lipase [Armatimonadota bacterium]